MEQTFAQLVGKNIGSIYKIIEGLKLDEILASKKFVDSNTSNQTTSSAKTKEAKFNEAIATLQTTYIENGSFSLLNLIESILDQLNILS